jgi:outer membrane protein assembly factor BamB
VVTKSPRSPAARLRRGAGALALLAAVALTAGCRSRRDWVMFRGEQGRGMTANAVYPPFGVKWKLRLQVDRNRLRAFNPPVVKDGTIYFGSTDGNFYALDIETGFMRWVFKTEAAINSVAAADKDVIYLGSNDGKVYAVDQKDGKLRWSFQTGRTVQSTIVRYKDRVLFTSDGGATFLLTPEGVEMHEIPNPVWYYHTFQVFDDVMYFAPGPESRPVSFGAYDLNSYAYLWVIDTLNDGATWYSFPAIDGRSLYYSTAGDFGKEWELKYYALDRRTGKERWSYSDTSDWGRYLDADPEKLFDQNLDLLDYLAPAVWRDKVIYTSGDTVVRAFQAGTGRLSWKRQFRAPTTSAPTVAGDRVYFGIDASEGKGPELVVLSARDGKVLWTLPLEGAMLSAPVVAGKWIVFGTHENLFYVLEELF